MQLATTWIVPEFFKGALGDPQMHRANHLGASYGGTQQWAVMEFDDLGSLRIWLGPEAEFVEQFQDAFVGSCAGLAHRVNQGSAPTLPGPDGIPLGIGAGSVDRVGQGNG